MLLDVQCLTDEVIWAGMKVIAVADWAPRSLQVVVVGRGEENTQRPFNLASVHRKCRWRSSAPSDRRYRPTWRRPSAASSICRPPWRRWSRAMRATQKGNCPRRGELLLCLHDHVCMCELNLSPLCPSLQRSNSCGVLDSKERPVRPP